MFPWILIVLLTLPNGTKQPTAIAGFQTEAVCEAIRKGATFTNRDNTPAPTFCRKATYL